MGAYEVISYKILPLFHKQTEHNLEGKHRSVGTSCRCTDWGSGASRLIKIQYQRQY